MNIKKLAAAVTIAIAASSPVTAQEQCLHIYRDGSVAKSYKISSIDSMLFDEDNCNIDLYRDGIRYRAGSYVSTEKIEIGDALVPSGIYMGIIGFNDELYTKEIGSLMSTSQSSFTGFVDKLRPSSGTILYYAVNEALNVIKTASLPDDLMNVPVVILTSDLDQGSTIMGPHSTNDAWTTALSSRIGTEKVGGISITTYAIGFKGDDVTDVTQFRKNLQSLSSSADNAIEISDLSELRANFDTIVDNIYNESSIHTVSLTIPEQSDGRRVRFTFDNVSSATGSSMYIEGTFRLSDRSLTDISYCGLTCLSGTTVKGVEDGIYVTFTFDEVMSLTSRSIKANFIDQWSYISGTSEWQINSEFTLDNNTEVEIQRKSAVIMLVLDCSESLGGEFYSVRSMSNYFINMLAGYGNEEGFSYIDLDEKKIIENMLYTDMVKVDGGTFWMGAQCSSSSSPNYDSSAVSNVESPVHQVTLGDYYIGKYEVTQKLWESVMNYSGECADGSTMSAYPSGPWLGSSPSSVYGQGAYYPACYVSHDDIVNVFLPRLNRITGREYSLPTEAEWEYAARGGNKSKGYKYSGSNTVGDVAWYYVYNSTLQPVGTRFPNELGIYDMSGNVMEWCNDWYGDYTSSSQINPTGPAEPSALCRRVLRGGSAFHGEHYCRVSYRANANPDTRGNGIGFRLVLRSL